jgi:hypothetical protein
MKKSKKGSKIGLTRPEARATLIEREGLKRVKKFGVARPDPGLPSHEERLDLPV